MSDSLKQHLQPYRQKIDALDDRIIDLLEERVQMAKTIGEIKKARGVVTCSVLEREAEVIRRLQERSHLLKPHIRAIYGEIISACLAIEKSPSVAYLGPIGTYSHEAALKMFGQSAHFSPVATITGAIQEAEKGNANFAIVPFENSATGTVGETMEGLSNTTLQINGEMVLRVRHNLLMATHQANAYPACVSKIYGHPQALEQCRHWLAENMPKAVLSGASSSAAAAESVAQSREPVAAIGSLAAKSIHQLAVVAENIEDTSDNSTRFLILGKRSPGPSGDDKTSFIMTARDEAGAMYHLLQPLAENAINMTKLESRPVPRQSWKYLFFVDIGGHQQDSRIADALAKTGSRAASLKVLGSYPRAIE